MTPCPQRRFPHVYYQIRMTFYALSDIESVITHYSIPKKVAEAEGRDKRRLLVGRAIGGVQSMRAGPELRL